jgi:hypothetical protein
MVSTVEPRADLQPLRGAAHAMRVERLRGVLHRKAVRAPGLEIGQLPQCRQGDCRIDVTKPLQYGDLCGRRLYVGDPP